MADQTKIDIPESRSGPRRNKWWALVEQGIVTAEELEAALAENRARHVPVPIALFTHLQDSVPEEVAPALAKFLGVPYVPILETEVDSIAVEFLPEAFIRSHLALPFKKENSVLHVAMGDPTDLATLQEIKLLTGVDVRRFYANPLELQEVINNHFNPLNVAVTAVRDSESELSQDDYEDEASREEALSPDSPVVRLVDSLIAGAIDEGASDIHIEPLATFTKVRYRIDGVLNEAFTLPRRLHRSVVSRIKIISGLNITEHRLPQDGRISMKAGQRHFDMRVSTLLTVNGEKVVMRLLDQSSVQKSMDDLGMFPEQQRLFERLLSRPWGMILVTGPTGSGKTTTLYTALGHLNSVEKNIVTVEDPVEYRLVGINQVQINPKAKVTFANSLRAILRQDPDIVMVGEIRDKETAQIAVHAALTGHLVMSTLHTNDAPSALTRLVDMGVEPFLVAASVVGVLGQRLVRLVCPECKEPYQPSEEALYALGLSPDQAREMNFFKGAGCKLCNKGYKGRMGIYEIMQVTSGIRELLVKDGTTDAIRDYAIKHDGMMLMREAAIKRMAEGLTTAEEAARVTQEIG